MNRKHRSFLASLLLLALFGVFAGCRETPINNNPVPRGRQFVGEINGVVRDGNTGAPLSGVTVRLIGAEGQPGGETVTATTNADGIYIFRNLQAGFYKIAATPPAGYAPTRVADVELRDNASPNTGVTVVRVARDIRFFTANASVQGRLTIRTPDGRTLPAPAGTPVFIDFTIPGGNNPGNPNERTRTVGDVQVATVQATVRTDTTIGGRTVNIIISGLPAVGSLATAGEFPTLVVPIFEVGGVVYGDPATGRAAQVPLRGLRPGTISLIEPNQLEIPAQTGPTRLLATSNAPGGISAPAFGTTDSIIIVFNKPMQPATVQARIRRTRTPYSLTQITTFAQLSGVTTTALPAGTYLGIPCAANQAYRITLNRPFVTGTEHEIYFDSDPIAADGAPYTAHALLIGDPNADVSLRRFTTRTGLRVISVTVGGVSVQPGAVALNVPTSGTVNITFAVPAGASIRPVVLRGAGRTLEMRTGHTLNAGAIASGDVPVVPPGTGPVVDRDTATVTGGNTITFNYSGFPSDSSIHIAPAAASIRPGEEQSNEVPFLTAAPAVRGNIASTLPGDFGIGQTSNSGEDLTSEYNLVRLLRTVAPGAVPPIQILSFPSGTSVPTDTVIRIRFSRPLPSGAIPSADLVRTSGFQNSRIRIFRTAVGVPNTSWNVGTQVGGGDLPGSATGANAAANDYRDAGIGSPIDTGYIGYRATLEEGGTVLTIRRLERPSFLGGQTIPFEAGTAYSVELAIPGLATGTGTTTITTPGTAATPTGQFVRFRFRTVRGIEATGLRVEPAVPASPGDSGRIVITFSRPLAPGVVFRTNGPGANCALFAAPVPALNATNVDAARRDANAGLPPFAATNPLSQRRVKTYIDGTDSTRIDSVGTISADRLSVSFRYFYLPNGNHRFIAFPPAVDNGTYAVPDAFARDISRGVDTSTALNIADYPSAIRSELPGDYGLAGPASNYRNRIDFPVNITPPPPPVAPPVFVVSTSVTPANQLNYATTDSVSITFSRAMNPSTVGYTVQQLTNTFGSTFNPALNLTPDTDTAWQAGNTRLVIRRKRYVQPDNSLSDTAKPFLAGAVYRVELSGAQAVDGGTLRGFTGLAFRTVPRTRVTGAVITGGRLGNNTRNLFTGTGNYTVGDTVGQIRITFSREPFGIYTTRDNAPFVTEFRFRLRRFGQRQGAPNINVDLTNTPFYYSNAPTARGVVNSAAGPNQHTSALIDSIPLIQGNTMIFAYYVSDRTLFRNPANIPSTDYVVQLRPEMTGLVPSDSTLTGNGPRYIRDADPNNTTNASTIDPPSIRSNIPGDLGVLGLDTFDNAQFSGATADGRAFDIKFGITSQNPLPTSSAFPDFLVNAVRNATETVTEVAQKTVSTVRSWWNRFRGE